jgi:hypothetical protein
MNWKYLLIKYSIEFVVIFLGIFLSFYIEKQNALEYKQDLKDQSLRRLIKNIQVDLEDNNINLHKNTLSIEYLKVLQERGEELFETDKDSLGYYLTSMAHTSTIFIDNQEEYITLRNSGLIELIEDDSLVKDIQYKYAIHAYFKKYEETIRNAEIAIEDIVNRKTSNNPVGKLIFLEKYIHGEYGAYNYNEPLSNHDLNVIANKTNRCYHYVNHISEAMQRDTLLIESIRNEID